MDALTGAAFTVTRGRLGLPNLSLNTGAADSGIQVVEFGPGRRVMNLVQATSPVSDGAVLVGAQAGLQTARVRVRVWGTPGEIADLVEEVSEAFAQFTYGFTCVTAAGAVLANWTCQPADVSVGASGVFDAGHLLGGWQDVDLDVPRQPDFYRL